MLSRCENDVKTKQDELAAPWNNIEQGERGTKIFLPARWLSDLWTVCDIHLSQLVLTTIVASKEMKLQILTSKPTDFLLLGQDEDHQISMAAYGSNNYFAYCLLIELTHSFVFNGDEIGIPRRR